MKNDEYVDDQQLEYYFDNADIRKSLHSFVCNDRRIVRNADQVHHERQYGTLKHPVGSADTTLRQVHFSFRNHTPPISANTKIRSASPIWIVTDDENTDLICGIALSQLECYVPAYRCG